MSLGWVFASCCLLCALMLRVLSRSCRPRQPTPPLRRRGLPSKNSFAALLADLPLGKISFAASVGRHPTCPINHTSPTLANWCGSKISATSLTHPQCGLSADSCPTTQQFQQVSWCPRPSPPHFAPFAGRGPPSQGKRLYLPPWLPLHLVDLSLA